MNVKILKEIENTLKKCISFIMNEKKVRQK